MKICQNTSCFKDYSGPGWSGRFCSQACAIEHLQRTMDGKMREVGKATKVPPPHFHYVKDSDALPEPYPILAGAS